MGLRGEGQTPTDHPQPLLERRRGDASNSDVATSRALVGETDPIVRGYTENLRRQVANIAARNGVNARDVFRADVQARMSPDDLDAVAALVKQIGLIGKKNAGSREAVDFRRALDRKEAAARKVLDAALEGPWAKENMYELIRVAIRSGAPEVVWDYAHREDFNRYEFHQSQLKVELLIAIAKNVPSADSEERRRILNSLRWRLDDVHEGFDRRLEAELQASLARFPVFSDEELLGELELTGHRDKAIRPFAIATIRMEMQRRGMEMETDLMRSLVADAREIMKTNEEFLQDEFLYFQSVAELNHAYGKDAATPLWRAVDCSKKESDMQFKLQILAGIMRSAGKIGAFTFMDELMASDLEIVGADFLRESARTFWLAAAKGCAEGGHFDKAVEILRACADQGRRRTAADEISETFLEHNQIERAERIYGEFVSGGLIRLRENAKYVAARAWSGEDVMEEARETSERIARMGGSPKFVLANAAIATIGYARAMKRGMGL